MEVYKVFKIKFYQRQMIILKNNLADSSVRHHLPEQLLPCPYPHRADGLSDWGHISSAALFFVPSPHMLLLFGSQLELSA